MLMSSAEGGLQKRNRVLYGAHEAYHHMCRFFSGFFMLHPLLAEVAAKPPSPPPSPGGGPTPNAHPPHVITLCSMRASPEPHNINSWI